MRPLASTPAPSALSPTSLSIAEWQAEAARLTRAHRLRPALVLGDRHLTLPWWYRPGRRPAAPVILLTAGIHGDEPAGPLAWQQWLAKTTLSDAFTWVMFPLLNPRAWGTSQRTNPDGIDLNRDFRRVRSPEVAAWRAWLCQSGCRPAVHLSLHEDWESDGFYLYEINTGPLPSLAQPLLRLLGQRAPLAPGPMADGHRLRAPGWIAHDAHPHEPEGWPEAIYLVRRAPLLSLTFEGPGARVWPERVAALTEALTLATALLPVALASGTGAFASARGRRPWRCP